MPGSKVVDLKIMTHTDMGAYVPSAILSFKKNLFIWLHRVLVVECELFIVASFIAAGSGSVVASCEL